MTTTKTALVALDAKTILVTGFDALTLDAAKTLVGRTVEMPTLLANETAAYTIASVSQERPAEDIYAWVVRDGQTHGRHARLVETR